MAHLQSKPNIHIIIKNKTKFNLWPSSIQNSTVRYRRYVHNGYFEEQEIERSFVNILYLKNNNFEKIETHNDCIKTKHVFYWYNGYSVIKFTRNTIWPIPVRFVLKWQIIFMWICNIQWYDGFSLIMYTVALHPCIWYNEITRF